MREITVDLSPLENAGSADLDIIGQIAGDSESNRWRRIKADASTYTFCRDVADDDFSQFYVVLSNHSWNRIANGAPDPAAAVTGFYNVTAQDHCDVPVAYKGTFKVTTTSSPDLANRFQRRRERDVQILLHGGNLRHPKLHRQQTRFTTATSWTAPRRRGRRPRSPSIAASTSHTRPRSRTRTTKGGTGP